MRKEKSEPVVGGVGEESEVSGGKTVQARDALRSSMAGFLEFVAGERGPTTKAG